jgi:hypothetical protein
MKSLADSFEALYFAFDDVPKPRTIEGCPCCIERKNICTLLSEPLRELTPDDLSSYASSAFLTVGEEADYLYFLPRIIEISSTDPGWRPDVPVTGCAISETRPREWPSQRQAALGDVLHAVVHTAAEDCDGGSIVDDWICAIAKMGLEVGRFLEQIESHPALLLSFYERNSQSMLKNRLGNSFWDQTDEGYDEVLAWFKSPKVSQIIMDGYGMNQHSQQVGAPNP